MNGLSAHTINGVIMCYILGFDHPQFLQPVPADAVNPVSLMCSAWNSESLVKLFLGILCCYIILPTFIFLCLNNHLFSNQFKPIARINVKFGTFPFSDYQLQLGKPPHPLSSPEETGTR